MGNRDVRPLNFILKSALLWIIGLNTRKFRLRRVRKGWGWCPCGLWKCHREDGRIGMSLNEYMRDVLKNVSKHYTEPIRLLLVEKLFLFRGKSGRMDNDQKSFRDYGGKTGIPTFRYQYETIFFNKWWLVHNHFPSLLIKTFHLSSLQHNAPVACRAFIWSPKQFDDVLASRIIAEGTESMRRSHNKRWPRTEYCTRSNFHSRDYQMTEWIPNSSSIGDRKDIVAMGVLRKEASVNPLRFGRTFEPLVDWSYKCSTWDQVEEWSNSNSNVFEEPEWDTYIETSSVLLQECGGKTTETKRAASVNWHNCWASMEHPSPSGGNTLRRNDPALKRTTLFALGNHWMIWSNSGN